MPCQGVAADSDNISSSHGQAGAPRKELVTVHPASMHCDMLPSLTASSNAQVQPVTDPRTGALLAMLVAIDKAEKDSQDCLFRNYCFTESDRYACSRGRLTAGPGHGAVALGFPACFMGMLAAPYHDSLRSKDV